RVCCRSRTAVSPQERVKIQLQLAQLSKLVSASFGDGRVSRATETKERNPLRHTFKVTSGNRSIKLRVRNGARIKDWVSAINDAGLRPPEG
ncbi:Phospholipase D zeta 1, partial [Linum perenne]